MELILTVLTVEQREEVVISHDDDICGAMSGDEDGFPVLHDWQNSRLNRRI